MDSTHKPSPARRAATRRPRSAARAGGHAEESRAADAALILADADAALDSDRHDRRRRCGRAARCARQCRRRRHQRAAPGSRTCRQRTRDRRGRRRHGAASNAEAAAKLDGVVAVAEPFVANLEVLAVCLRDTNFVAHLVSTREAELLAEATRRLKAITGGRFGFTPGFGIVNIGSGETRSPDALSGGERFQAALALALALVEIASRGAGTLDAVFVDEGFGSLDSAALDVALETLGTVAGGGKMVALISHLRPVAEYVDTVLHVTRDDLLGSRITLLDAEDREQLLADDIRSGLTAVIGVRSRARRAPGAMIGACARHSVTASASSSRSSPSATAATSSPRSARPAASACSGRSPSRRTQLEVELDWIDEHVGDRPYGVDIIVPAKYTGIEQGGMTRKELSRADPRRAPPVRRRPDAQVRRRRPARRRRRRRTASSSRGRGGDDVMGFSHESGHRLLDMVWAHPKVRLVANALGPAPDFLVTEAHERGVLVAGLVGTVVHAERQQAAGVDLVIAQGSEAGGHTGEIGTMVLVPAGRRCRVADAGAGGRWHRRRSPDRRRPRPRRRGCLVRVGVADDGGGRDPPGRQGEVPRRHVGRHAALAVEDRQARPPAALGVDRRVVRPGQPRAARHAAADAARRRGRAAHRPHGRRRTRARAG